MGGTVIDCERGRTRKRRAAAVRARSGDSPTWPPPLTEAGAFFMLKPTQGNPGRGSIKVSDRSNLAMIPSGILILAFPGSFSAQVNKANIIPRLGP